MGESNRNNIKAQKKWAQANDQTMGALVKDGACGLAVEEAIQDIGLAPFFQNQHQAIRLQLDTIMCPFVLKGGAYLRHVLRERPAATVLHDSVIGARNNWYPQGFQIVSTKYPG